MFEIDKVATLYQEALQSEFPQYGIDVEEVRKTSFIPRAPLRQAKEDAHIIHVWKDRDEECPMGNGELILMAEFLSSSVKITCWKDTRRSIDTIDYADPRFTEDIIRDRLAAYDTDPDTFMTISFAKIDSTLPSTSVLRDIKMAHYGRD